MAGEFEKIMSDKISRRDLVKKAGLGAGGVMMASVIAACGGSTTTTTAGGATGTTATTGGTTATSGSAPPAGTIKIGSVSPQTGPASSFGEVDPYILGLATKALAGGIRPSAARRTRCSSSRKMVRATRNEGPKSLRN